MILLEINYSIVSAKRTKSGAVRARIVILIAILALGRKLILVVYTSAGADVLLALHGFSLSPGVLYWLLTDSDHGWQRNAPLSTGETFG